VIDPERRRQIEGLFEEALERPAAERAAWLASACHGDPELLEEVRALLAAHELAERLFEPDAEGAGAAEPTGERLGRYRIVREIGRGGMGVVYLGERADGQYQRRVAIKLIATTDAADPLHQRFLAERQILAGLDHPNIARLLDGDLTDDHRPYLVLEYIDGLPITTYCDRHRLSIEERLKLFLEVCAAVQHAHQNLIIHRDLKPSNILVTTAGQVKLLDFGIAKLLNPALSAASSPVTRLDLRIMTPEYASPEQVRGESLTTASDIYSLGVLLYELLTGSAPYQLESGSPAEILEAVCGRDPERPSTRVLHAEPVLRGSERRDEITPEQRSAARDTTVERLRGRLRGDLDSIVLMALRKEPARRFGSADLLAQDIGRHLEGLPVSAHQGSTRYRVRKFVQRHRMQTIAASLILLSLVAGVGVASWQARLAGQALDRAEEERTSAELALRQSETVTEFLMGMFEASDPDLARGDSITARELLERGAARAEALEEEPVLQAQLLEVVGRVYRSMGEYPRAEALLARAVALRTKLHGRDHPEVAMSLVHLAEVLHRRAQYDSAQVLLEEARATQLRTLGDSAPAVATTLHVLSRNAEARGDLAEAERLGREALALRQRVHGRDHALTAATRVHLGWVLRGRGDLNGAEQVLRESLELRRSADGRGAAGLAGVLELADLLQYNRRDAGQAEPLYREALAVLRATSPPEPTQHVRALRGLSRILEDRGDLSSAEELLREDLDLRRKVYGTEHPFVSAGMLHLAGFYERTARLREAEQLFREVAVIDRKLLGADHPTHAGTLGAIARTLAAQGRLDEADSLLTRVYEIRVARLGPSHPLVGRTFYWQADLRIRRGDHAEADALLRRALEIAQAQSTGTSTAVREALEKLVLVNEALGRPEEAERFRDLAAQQPAGPER
jgi:eukaryotic-like serine/threonine-protein kinase